VNEEVFVFMKFGEKFRAEREKLGLSQAEIAAKLGVSRNMITRYETGAAHPRNREAYKRVAELFGVDFNYLLSDDEDFVVRVSEQYGEDARKQAEELVDGIHGLFAGGSLSDEDKDAVMQAMQDIYWESKGRSVRRKSLRGRRKKKDADTNTDAGAENDTDNNTAENAG